MLSREHWFQNLTGYMAPRFEALGYKLPRLRISYSLMRKRKHLGVCYSPECSEDGTTEILIRIDQADPLQAAAILAHELAHAAVGVTAGHKGPFTKCVRALGLEGPATATVPGDEFRHWVSPLLDVVGPIPHAALDTERGTSSGPKPQRGRLLKAECAVCGYTVRVTRSWLEKGAPICPGSGHGSMAAEEPEEEEPAKAS